MFTKVFEFWENHRIPLLLLPLNEVGAHLVIVLLDELARIYV